MISAYPLSWPTGWPRTHAGDHKFGKFGTKRTPPGSSYARTVDITITEASGRVLDELSRMGINRQDVVISTNVRTRLDGLPRSGEKEPNDSGAAVYWETRKGDRRVMAIDQYVKVADNLAAIAATLDAMRAIERHGGAQILDRAFTGFLALPAPGGSASVNWRQVMGFAPGEPVDAETLRTRFRKLASERHPDKESGSHAAMAALNDAHAQAQEEIGL
jgi:hypothetical protein